MNLIESLAAGIRGAEDGSVELYARGTSTRATWYTSFEGTTAVSSGADVALDSDGRAIVYVNRLVTVLVKNQGGETVTTFVAGSAASTVEYQGAGFTGANYATAATGAGSGYPTTLQAILDLAATAFGGSDWRVNVDGTATPIGEALGNVLGLFFYPKSPTYGAAGDGVTDDTAAVQACITAAQSAGGGVVYLGPGAYRITSVLTVPSTVSLWGDSKQGATVIAMDHASNPALTFSGVSGTQPPQSVRGIQITALQANSGALITLGSQSSVLFDRCYIGSTFNSGTLITVHATAQARLDDCFMQVASGSTSSMVSGGTIHARRTYFAPTVTTYAPSDGFVYGAAIYLDTCFFSSGATTGTQNYVAWNSTTVVGDIRGCTFSNGAGGTVTAMTFGIIAAASSFRESGCVFGSSVTAYSYTLGTSTYSTVFELGSRRERAIAVSVSAAAASLPVQQYGVINVTSTFAGNVSLSFDGHIASGAQVAIVVTNDNGTNRDFTISTVPAAVGTATITASGGRNAMVVTAIGANGAFSDAKYYAGNWNT